MVHLRHNVTGEWKFNAGAGWTAEWEAQPAADGDLAYAKHMKIERLKKGLKRLIEGRYDEPEQRSLIKIILEAKVDGLVNRYAYANAAWDWVISMQTIYYGKKAEINGIATTPADVHAVVDPDYTAALAADPAVSIQTALGIPD